MRGRDKERKREKERKTERKKRKDRTERIERKEYEIVRVTKRKTGRKKEEGEISVQGSTG